MSGAKQPEALRLAEQLENLPYQIYDLPEPKLAAATLRTQHAMLERALESLQELVPDPECDFGPAYAGAERRKDELIAAITQHLEPK